ncbi:Uncharacterized protein HZ326_3646 [Fusarium oxysporum f. sp. albedinis]|nr:Uncharacterized protein HZ326_3646 [Fusarium oxysporum f. sp. albedinis]
MRETLFSLAASLFSSVANHTSRPFRALLKDWPWSNTRECTSPRENQHRHLVLANERSDESNGYLDVYQWLDGDLLCSACVRNHRLLISQWRRRSSMIRSKHCRLGIH